MEKILTIIIPSYNIERYIDSIMPGYLYEPLFKKVNLLFIDDGAKDNTVKLLSEYEKKFPDYISIIRKENGGHGSVINTGVGLVKTKYFKVVDGDDWVDSEELLKLCEYLEQSDSDLVVSDFIYEFSNRSSISYGFDETKSFKYKIHLHNATFLTELWTKNKIRVREKVFYEDAQYVLLPLEFVKDITYFKACIYHYRCDNPNQSVNALQQLKHVDDYILVAEDLCNYIDRLSNSKNVKQEVKQYIFDNVVRIVFGAYEICTSKGLAFSEARRLCKILDSKFKPHKKIYLSLLKRYRKLHILKFLNYLGLRIYLKNH